MIGIIFLVIALLLYGSPRYRYLSYFMYVCMLLGGLSLLTDSVLGVKNKDIALVYTFSINAFLLFQHKFTFPSKEWWVRCYKVLLFFLVGSVLFSYFYYRFTSFQILQGGRDFLLLFSLPILIRIRVSEFQRIMELLLWITVVTSILYSLQIVAGRPLMPYSLDYSFDSATGLVRLYNRPVMLQFYLLASFVCPRFFTGNVNIYRLLFFVALMCTLGRTGIFISIFSILLAMTFTGRTTKLIKVVVILGLLFLPFFDMVSQRYEGSGTTEDLSNTMSGGYKNFSTGDGTMTYRIAWVYERGEYLIHRPIGEQIFGMGLISGSQDIVYKMYHFRVGLIGEAGLIEQLYTPDISYGNLLTRLGFLGGAIYIVFVISLMILFFRHRKDLPILTICTAQIIVMFIGAFSGSAMSNPSNFVIYFLTLSLLYSKNSEGLLRNRSSKWLFEKNNNNQ